MKKKGTLKAPHIQNIFLYLQEYHWLLKRKDVLNVGELFLLTTRILKYVQDVLKMSQIEKTKENVIALILCLMQIWDISINELKEED
jgi:hypothetical protein